MISGMPTMLYLPGVSVMVSTICLVVPVPLASVFRLNGAGVADHLPRMIVWVCVGIEVGAGLGAVTGTVRHCMQLAKAMLWWVSGPDLGLDHHLAGAELAETDTPTGFRFAGPAAVVAFISATATIGFSPPIMLWQPGCNGRSGNGSSDEEIVSCTHSFRLQDCGRLRPPLALDCHAAPGFHIRTSPFLRDEGTATNWHSATRECCC